MILAIVNKISKKKEVSNQSGTSLIHGVEKYNLALALSPYHLSFAVDSVTSLPSLSHFATVSLKRSHPSLTD